MSEGVSSFLGTLISFFFPFDQISKCDLFCWLSVDESGKLEEEIQQGSSRFLRVSLSLFSWDYSNMR